MPRWPTPPAWTPTCPSPTRATTCAACSPSGSEPGGPGSERRGPLGDAGALLAPGGVELDALDLLDRTLVGPADLARLRAREPLHQPQVAVGQMHRRLGPVLDDRQQRLVGDRRGQ